MSKYVKKLQMKDLRDRLDGVEEMVFVDVVGLSAIQDNELRLDLRKKGINLRVAPNSLTQKILGEKGIDGLDAIFAGPSAVAWGGDGIVELAKEMADWAKKLSELQIKGGYVSGQPLDSDGVSRLSKLPSREELLGTIAGLALSPGGTVAGAALGPGGVLVGQIKSIAEKEEAPAEA